MRCLYLSRIQVALSNMLWQQLMVPRLRLAQLLGSSGRCYIERATKDKRAKSRVFGKSSGRFAQNSDANRHVGEVAGCGVCSLDHETLHWTASLVMEHSAALCPPKPSVLADLLPALSSFLSSVNTPSSNAVK